jgi:SOS response regulatory protein OraA/RecX
MDDDIDSGKADELLHVLDHHAFTILLDYLAKSEHSELQCRNLLKRKEFHSSIINHAIQQCKKLRYLDDGRFAEVMINSFANRKASKRAIVAKLREQHIPSSVWEHLLNELYPQEMATGNITELMAKYCVTHRDLPRAKLREKVFGYLFRKGFELSDIQSAWDDLN